MEDILLSTFHSIQDGSSSPSAFIRLAESIDWTIRSSDELASTTEMALQLELIPLARHLMAVARDHNITNPKIEKLQAVLGRGKVAISTKPPNQSLDASMRWLSENANKYEGLWVALDGAILLGTAETRKNLVEKVGERPTILITRIV